MDGISVALSGSVEFARYGAVATRSKTGQDRGRHAAEKASRQAIVIAQHEGQMPDGSGVSHGFDITIQI
jgi:hypothetical protein